MRKGKEASEIRGGVEAGGAKQYGEGKSKRWGTSHAFLPHKVNSEERRVAGSHPGVAGGSAQPFCKRY